MTKMWRTGTILLTAATVISSASVRYIERDVGTCGSIIGEVLTASETITSIICSRDPKCVGFGFTFSTDLEDFNELGSNMYSLMDEIFDSSDVDRSTCVIPAYAVDRQIFYKTSATIFYSEESCTSQCGTRTSSMPAQTTISRDTSTMETKGQSSENSSTEQGINAPSTQSAAPSATGTSTQSAVPSITATTIQFTDSSETGITDRSDAPNVAGTTAQSATPTETVTTTKIITISAAATTTYPVTASAAMTTTKPTSTSATLSTTKPTSTSATVTTTQPTSTSITVTTTKPTSTSITVTTTKPASTVTTKRPFTPSDYPTSYATYPSTGEVVCPDGSVLNGIGISSSKDVVAGTCLIIGTQITTTSASYTQANKPCVLYPTYGVAKHIKTTSSTTTSKTYDHYCDKLTTFWVVGTSLMTDYSAPTASSAAPSPTPNGTLTGSPTNWILCPGGSSSGLWVVEWVAFYPNSVSVTCVRIHL